MAPGILRLDKFAFDYIHNEPSGSASSRGTVQNDCFDSCSITSSDSSKVILTPTSSSSPSPPATGTSQHKENIWAVPPATNKASQRPRSLSLPASPITDLADITNILHSPVKPPKRLEVSQCPTVELFSPIPRDSKIFCHAPPLGPWILKTYWHVETYPASSSLVIIQAGLSAAGATQGLVIEIDKALRSLNLPARPKSWIQSFIPFRFSSMFTLPKPFNNTIERINLYLLRCASLLACDQPGMGLKDADEALRIAEAENVYFMRSKSHLYRGLCFRKMARWVEASSAFTQAASIKAWAGRVRELKSEAEDNIARSRNIMPKRVRFAD